MSELQTISDTALMPSLTELRLAYKELQESKMLIRHLLDQNKNLVKQLQAFKKNTNQAKHNQQNFLANISHDIRTPLHAIVGLSNSLKDITDENEKKENIAIIENAAFVLGSVIENILDTADMDVRKAKLNKHPFDLKALIKNLQTTFTYRLKDKPVELKVEIDERIPDLVEGDEQKILHVLFNLLSNSERFTESGTIKLSVDVVKVLQHKMITAFTVEDTGVGLSSNSPRRSYERFEDYREKRKTLNEEGLGLGLPITSTLIKLLKGDVRVDNNNDADPAEGNASLESNVTRGVKITITIPLKQCIENSQYNVSNDGTSLSNLNVLIAEDTSVNRKYFAILLNKWNVPYTFVNNGREAIDKINTHDFDLVLMDINMPELDGFETTEAIRKTKDQKKSSVPIVGVSASVLSEYKTRGKKMGMNDFLSKPFKPERLKELLMHYADEKQTRDFSFLNEEMFSDYFGNDYAAAAEVFKIFIKESIPEMNNWEDLLNEKGTRELQVRAHALKSVMKMIGLFALSQQCLDLEQACNHQGADVLKEKIKKINITIRQIQPEIVKQYKFITKMSNKK